MITIGDDVNVECGRFTSAVGGTLVNGDNDRDISVAGATMAPFLGYPAVFSPQDAFRLRRRNSSLENLNQVRLS